MAVEHFGVKDAPAMRPDVSDREFSITWKGYDREEVRAFLKEIEADFRELEASADQVTTRLTVAQAEMIPRAEVDEAMIAIFDAKERLLDKARRRAERIEADAMERARAEQREIAAEIVMQAQEEARRIIQVAITGTTPVTEDSISDVARREADRLVGEAQLVADHWIQKTVPVPEAVDTGDPDQPPIQAVVVETEADGEFEPSPDRGASEHDEVDGRLTVPFEDDGAGRLSRYARNSARLPSIGDDASKVLGSMESLRWRDGES